MNDYRNKASFGKRQEYIAITLSALPWLHLPHAVSSECGRLTGVIVDIEIMTARGHTPKKVAFRKPRPF